MIGSSDGPRSGRWIGTAGRTVGKLAASHLTKPSDAVSAALLRFYQATAMRAADVDRIRTPAAATGRERKHVLGGVAPVARLRLSGSGASRVAGR